MAATALAGKAGTVQICVEDGTAAVVGKIKSWNIDIGYDTLDVTSFDSADDWREFLAGLSQWSGSFDGHWAYATDTPQTVIVTALLTPAVLEIELWVDATYGWYGDVFVNATSITTNVDGTVDASFTFQGTGKPTYGEPV